MNWKLTDLIKNKIKVVITNREYVIHLKEQLSRRRLVLDSNAVAFSWLTSLADVPFNIDKYFDIRSPSSTDSDASSAIHDLQQVTCTEVFHYVTILHLGILQDQDCFQRNKESHIHALLHALDSHVNQIDSSLHSCLKFGGLWDFPLIAELPTFKRKYTPKSDVSLRINKIPHLLLEIVSDATESDCRRMLLQAACLARLGNVLGKHPEHPFIVSAIYVDLTLSAKWHFVYQPHTSDTVEYVVKDFNLQDRKSTFDFVFWLYNFVALAKGHNSTLHDPDANIAKLGLDVDGMNLPGLTTRFPKRKTRDNDNAGNEPPSKRRPQGGDVESDTLFNVATMEALNRRGYTIPEIVEEFKPLLALTPKTRHAVSADGKDVIIKHTDEHEVEVLRYLHGKQSTKQTRIIPLLDVIDRRLIVLPVRTPLSQFLDLDASAGDVEQLALQFLEGVAYLQKTSVAHLDLKPDNIVVARDAETGEVNLAIIDFNIAVFADVEPTISASSGTPGWCAPEVSAGMSYNPLLADRWSCGRVLSTFTKHMEPGQIREAMCSFSQQLMHPDPLLRPPVTKLATCIQKTRRSRKPQFKLAPQDPHVRKQEAARRPRDVNSRLRRLTKSSNKSDTQAKKGVAMPLRLD